MWRSHYETTTDVPAETLYRVISDIENWSRWDDELEFVRMEGDVRPGARFVLKPKGGPNVSMSIESVLPPSRLVDIAYLPGAKLRTIHEFLPAGNQTTVRFTLEIWGILGFLWRKAVGEKQIAGAAAQIEALARYARSLD